MSFCLQVPVAPDLDRGSLAARMADKGYSGADVTNICRDAAMMSMRRAIAVGKHRAPS